MIEINNRNYSANNNNFNHTLSDGYYMDIKIDNNFDVNDMMLFLEWSDLMVQRSGNYKKRLRSSDRTVDFYGCYPIIIIELKIVRIYFDYYTITMTQ